MTQSRYVSYRRLAPMARVSFARHTVTRAIDPYSAFGFIILLTITAVQRLQ